LAVQEGSERSDDRSDCFWATRKANPSAIHRHGGGDRHSVTANPVQPYRWLLNAMHNCWAGNDIPRRAGLRAWRASADHRLGADSTGFILMLDHIEKSATWQVGLRYGLAIALFASAFGVRFHLFPQDSRLSYSTFYPAVFLALYFLGLVPGLLVMALSIFAGYYFFLTPFHSWRITPEGVVAASNFVFASLMAALIVTQLRRQRLVAQRAARELRDVYDQSPCAYFSLDTQGRFLQANAMTLRWLGAPERDVLGSASLKDFLDSEDVPHFDTEFERSWATGSLGPLQLDLISRAGTRRRVSLSASYELGVEGKACRNRSVMYDVTELERVRQRLETLTRHQNAMLDNELVGITMLRDRKIVWMNRAVERIFGYEPGELIGKSARIFYADDEGYAAFGDVAYPVLRQGNHFRSQLPLVRKNGELIWADVSGITLDGTDESMWMSLDVTDMKRRQEQVERVAFHDALTGLPNRILLTDRLRQAIPMANRLEHQLAVCFVDLDGFKAINDQYGHAAGDAVLRTVAHRLLECVRGNDTVARLGGDEFILVLTSLERREECDVIVDRVAKEVAQPIALGDAMGMVTASIGVAFSPDDDCEGERLVALADERMYAAKKAKRRVGVPT
jgi:diguanylate cyclase (GGDEF)-like protein/PAS domain S-box-containing protein